MIAHKLVILSGPVGVGKTTTGYELSAILVQRSVAHTFVDLDALTHTYPRPQGDPFGSEIGLLNLSSAWQNAVAQGSNHLIVARVIETRGEADAISRAVSIDDPYVIELNASNDTLIARIRKREIGIERNWHVKRALELSELLGRAAVADHKVNTDGRPVSDVAHELLDVLTRAEKPA